MDKLKSIFSKLESSIEGLRILVENQHRYSSTSNLILGGGAALSAFSVLTLPKWTSVAFIAMFSGYALYDRAKFNSLVVCKLGEIHAIFNEINDSINDLQKEFNSKEEMISFLKTKVGSFSEKVGQHSQDATVETEKSTAEINFEELLKKIQKLDIEVEEFGDECATYMRKEFSKTLKVCGLEFANYSEENRMLFATESAAINNVDCTARAIVTTASPKKIILKGHAFIPKV